MIGKRVSTRDCCTAALIAIVVILFIVSSSIYPAYATDNSVPAQQTMSETDLCTDYVTKKEYDMAIEECTKLIQSGKTDDSAYFINRGRAYLNKGQYDLAIADFNKAIELNTKSDRAYYDRGFIYYKKGQYDLAIADFNKAIELNPILDNAFLERGIVYYTKRQYDLAIADYTKAIELNPKKDHAYYDRGLAYYYGKGQYDLAIADFNKAIELNPKHAVSSEDAEKYSARGKAAFDMAKSDEDYAAAIAEFKKAVDAAPWRAQGYYNLGLAQEKAGQIDDAMKNFKRYLLAAPTAKDIQAVKNRIYGLEYKAEQKGKSIGEERKAMQTSIAGDWYDRADPTQEYTIRYQVTIAGNNVEIRPAWMYVRESNYAREPSWIPYRTDRFSPPVWRGTIEGLTITGTFHGDNSNWNGGANYTRPISGGISLDGKTLRLQYKAVSPAGGSVYPRLVTGWQEIDQELVLHR